MDKMQAAVLGTITEFLQKSVPNSGTTRVNGEDNNGQEDNTRRDVGVRIGKNNRVPSNQREVSYTIISSVIGEINQPAAVPVDVMKVLLTQLACVLCALWWEHISDRYVC